MSTQIGNNATRIIPQYTSMAMFADMADFLGMDGNKRKKKQTAS